MYWDESRDAAVTVHRPLVHLFTGATAGTVVQCTGLNVLFFIIMLKLDYFSIYSSPKT